MATTPQPIPHTQSPANNSTDVDPLAKLHRMSTTAGVASQQYVAVNATAIVAVLVGLVSTAAFLQPVLLFIPIAGVVVSLVAWRQIRGSNGTETGTPLAIFGLLVSAAVAGTVSYLTISEHLKVKHDVATFSDITHSLADDIKAKRYDGAYQRFNANFRERISLKTFEGRWESMQRPEYAGKMKSIEWNGATPQYDTVGGGTVSVSAAPFFMRFEKQDGGRFNFIFRDTGGGWQLEDIPEIFSPKQNDRAIPSK